MPEIAAGFTQLGAAGGGSTIGYGVTFDSDNNTIFVGNTGVSLPGATLNGTGDTYIAKYDTSKNLLWVRQLGVATRSTQSNEVVTNSNNDIYVAGQSTGGLAGNTLQGSQDGYIAKYNASGTQQWVVQFGGPGASVDTKGISLDSAGNVYAAGTISNGSLPANTAKGFRDGFVTKYDSDGNHQWTRQFGDASGNTEVQDMKVAANGLIYLVGYTTANLNGNTLIGVKDLFIAAYDSTGALQSLTTQGTAAAAVEGHGIAMDSSNNIYVTGRTDTALGANTQSGSFDLIVSKFNSTGVLQWVSQIGASTAVPTIGMGIAVDHTGHILVAGHTEGSVNGNTLTGTRDLLIVKFSPTGVLTSSRQAGASGQSTEGADIAISSTSDFAVTGRTRGQLPGATQMSTRDAFIGWNSL